MATRPAIFKWRQTEPVLILSAVRWYLRYSLSIRDVEELLKERGLGVDHTTVWHWVQRYGPELEERLRRHLKPTNKSWRVDETYVRVKGRWCYLYRAIDSTGCQTPISEGAEPSIPSAASCHQYGPGTDLWLGHPRHQEGWDLTPPLSAPTGAVLEQHSRARPPSDQTPGERQAGVPRIPGGAANDSGLRGDEYDSQGTGLVGEPNGGPPSDPIHPEALRTGYLRSRDEQILRPSSVSPPK